MRGVRSLTPPVSPPEPEPAPAPDPKPCEPEPDEETGSVTSEPAGPRYEPLTCRERCVIGCEILRGEATSLVAIFFILIWAVDRAHAAILRNDLDDLDDDTGR